MRRNDIVIVAVLVLLLLAWQPLYTRLIHPLLYPGGAPPPAEEGLPGATNAPPDLVAAPDAAADAAAPGAPDAEPARSPPAAPPAEDEPASAGPAQEIVLRNDRLELTWSSRGAALTQARLLAYRSTPDADSDRVALDFSSAPAMALEGLAGLGDAHDFTIEADPDGRRARFTRRTARGLAFTREVEVGDSYVVRVRDRIAVEAGAPPLEATAFRIRTGTMRPLPGESAARGILPVALDSLSPGGEDVYHWGSKLPGVFSEQQKTTGAPRPPMTVEREVGKAVDWVAAKNGYFVQILRPEGSAAGAVLRARRKLQPKEVTDPGHRPRVETVETSAALRFELPPTAPGGEPFSREYHLYTGPKDLAELEHLAYQQHQVMEFGMWGVISRFLLRTMNFIYRLIPNYGVAIMLLTVMIRLVFWPLTHKSSLNMKKMQELQPQVAEVRKKYRDNPQKMNREIMQVYRDNKVNPAAGCLPMLIQIPVFIALFYVLRSAIELRFAPFLWVRDLSQPENILAGTLPFGLGLNILPLIMTVLQWYQQRLTPATGDPSQQKMMLFMPWLMLIFFYNFAAGLVLYWSTNTALMVVQQMTQRYRAGHRPAAKA